jgi:hypothetical protein
MILLVGIGFFGVSFGLPVFSQGFGFGFVQGDFYIYQAFPPCMFSWGTFQNKNKIKIK